MSPSFYKNGPELLIEPPRPVEKYPENISLRWLIYAFFIGLFIIGEIFALNNLLDTYSLVKYGKKTNAVLYSKYIDDGRNGIHYILKYRYQVNNDLHYYSVRVSPTSYDKFAIGDTVVITYVPQNPAKHIDGSIHWRQFRTSIMITLIISLVVIAVLIICIGINEVQVSLRVELLRNGKVVSARITNKETVNNRNIVFYYITYAFSVDFEPMDVTYGVSGEFYNSLNVGDEIDVLYLPDNPAINQPYHTITDARIILSSNATITQRQTK